MPRRKIANTVVAASLVLFGLPVSAFALVDTPNSTASQTHPSVIVFNQKPKDGEIKVTYAYLPSPGHLVIYGAEANGKASSTRLGSVKLEAGDHRDIAVKLDKTVPSGTALWASLTNAEQHPFWKKSLPSENAFIVE